MHFFSRNLQLSLFKIPKKYMIMFYYGYNKNRLIKLHLKLTNNTTK